MPITYEKYPNDNPEILESLAAEVEQFHGKESLKDGQSEETAQIPIAPIKTYVAIVQYSGGEIGESHAPKSIQSPNEYWANMIA